MARVKQETTLILSSDEVRALVNLLGEMSQTDVLEFLKNYSDAKEQDECVNRIYGALSSPKEWER